MNKDQLKQAVKVHFDYHKDELSVIVTSDGECFHVRDANEAFNHKRTTGSEAWVATRDGSDWVEFTNATSAKSPVMTESDEKRKEAADRALAVQEEELLKKAEEKAALEAEAKAKADAEEAAKLEAEEKANLEEAKEKKLAKGK